MKNEKINKKDVIGFTIVLICAIALIATGIVLSPKDNNNNNENKENSSQAQSSGNTNNEQIEFESEYTIEEAGIKVVPTEELQMLSGENMENHYGVSATSPYKFISTSQDMKKSFVCFLYDEDELRDKTEEEFLNTLLEGAGIDEIKEVEVDGIKFYYAELDFDSDGEEYTECCYVYKAGDKFVCFDYSYPKDSTNEFTNMIKKA